MGSAEKIARFERLARAKAQDVQQSFIGPVKRFGVYDGTGCPKCAADAKAFAKLHCHGALEQVPIAQQECKQTGGEHLHGMCKACFFEWIEETLERSVSDGREDDGGA